MKQAMCLMIILFAGLSAAEETAESKSLSGSLETAVNNTNLGAAGGVPNDEALLESQLMLRWSNDQSAWYGIAWWGSSLPEQPGRLNDEVDLTLGYEHFWQHVALDASASYYAFDLTEKVEDDMWVADLKLKLRNLPVLQPYVHFRYFGEVGNESFDDGFFFFVGANRSQRLGFTLPWTENEQALRINVQSAFTTGAFDNPAAYVYTRLSVGTDIELLDNVFLAPDVTYQFSGKDQDGGPSDYADGNQLLVRLGLRVEF